METLAFVIAIIGSVLLAVSATSESPVFREKLSTLVFISIAALMSIVFWVTESKYKDGQVDALTGEIRYELVQNPDSTRTWEKIEGD